MSGLAKGPDPLEIDVMVEGGIRNYDKNAVVPLDHVAGIDRSTLLEAKNPVQVQRFRYRTVKILLGPGFLVVFPCLFLTNSCIKGDPLRIVFIFRLLGKPQYGLWIGYFEFLLAIPMIFLLLKAPQLERPALNYIQIGCMPAWLIVEALLDYILKIDFRNVSRMMISYVVLFFAGTGGMLGVAAIILFLIMAVLAFVQRAVTGMS